ncbi:MAG: prepilin-type N-terminal cleavage/methylation domain-containing protein [Candidatus Peribacteria bacterium]|jgi:prepilin-type N-terminal cleavage/methylation domain-containing protein|nr:prepilin-type N-terminal cleavage/methylation domain-containing protein [Candidatus Peribacteria bacterium]
MKKTAFKAFTLVEMLIVIVIIGILIAALLPRLQGAQGMARDTARQTALSQLQAGIVAYQSLNGKWPGTGNGESTQNMTMLVDSNIMSSLPSDPNGENIYTGLQNNIITGAYSYGIYTKNSITRGGFILMAKTETPGKSNRIMQNNTTAGGGIPIGTDMKTITPCKSVTLGASFELGT